MRRSKLWRLGEGLRRRGLAWAAAGALSTGIFTGCGALPRDVDPTAAVANEDTGLPVFGLRWQFQLGDRSEDHRPQEFASAALYHDRLFIGSASGMFYALRAKTGTQEWRIDVGAVSSRPVVAAGRIYVGTVDGAVVALDTDTGAVVWRYVTRGPILRSPTLVGDTLYVANEAEQVYALDARTGEFRWQYRGETPDEYTLRGHAGVVVAGDLVITGFANGSVVALRATSGSVAWLSSISAGETKFVDVDTTPVIDGDNVYVASNAGGVHALDLATGLVKWRLPIENIGGLAFDSGYLYAVAADEGVHAIDRGGNLAWRQGTRGGGEPAQPVLDDGYLFYALSESGLFVADQRTGVVHQYFDPGDGISAPPTIEDELAYVLSNRGILYALNVSRF